MLGAKSTNQQIFVRLSVLALFVASGLTAIAIAWKRTPIETHLAQQARKALTEADLPLVNVHFSGRDGNLSGLLPDSSVVDAITRTVSSVPGVRHVDSQLVIAPATETTLPPAPDKPVVNGLYAPVSEPFPQEQLDLSGVSFVYAQSVLTEVSFPALDRLAGLLKQHPQTNIEIGVHTDNYGTALGQMAVTQTRAETILQYLLNKGISISRLSAKGYGATQPIADNTHEANRARNRRIEITVLKESP